MASYISVSILSALMGGGYALVTYGSDLLLVLGWYMIGGWSGMGVMIAAMFLLGSLRRKHATAEQ